MTHHINPMFATLVKDIEYNAHMMQELAVIVQDIYRDNREATEQEIGICRQLRYGIGQSFKKIITLLDQLEYEMKAEPDHFKPDYKPRQ